MEVRRRLVLAFRIAGTRIVADEEAEGLKRRLLISSQMCWHLGAERFGVSRFLPVVCYKFKVAQAVKNLPAMQNLGSIPELGRSPGEGSGNPLQYSCLGNPMDRGTWQAIVHKVAKSRTQLND